MSNVCHGPLGRLVDTPTCDVRRGRFSKRPVRLITTHVWGYNNVTFKISREHTSVHSAVMSIAPTAPSQTACLRVSGVSLSAGGRVHAARGRRLREAGAGQRLAARRLHRAARGQLSLPEGGQGGLQPDPTGEPGGSVASYLRRCQIGPDILPNLVTVVISCMRPQTNGHSTVALYWL